MTRHFLRTAMTVLIGLLSWAAPAIAVPPETRDGARMIRAGQDRVPNEYLVVLKDDIPANDVPGRIKELTANSGARVKKIWTNAIKGFFAVMTEAQAERLRHNPMVESIEENARWGLSSAQQTNVDPRNCDPATATCTAVADDRLWHLDRADQNLAPPNNTYNYCTTGSGVTVYVVDSGVNKFHNEFAPNGARVAAGFNASGDQIPADDPCLGFALPPAAPYEYLEDGEYLTEIRHNGHGTAVASALGGNRVGIAKGVTIVPVKVSRCDVNSARARILAHHYEQYETMWRAPDGYNQTYYRARNAGDTAGEPLTNWPTAAGATFVDGGVTWEVFAPQAEQTTQMVVDGLNWILNTYNGGPAIVTMSTFMRASEGSAVDAVVQSLLNRGLTFVASANNQNGNACDTSPAHLSANSALITAGGSMILNRPWTVDLSDVPGPHVHEADGGPRYLAVEPAYNPTKAVREGRWICGAGDSDDCSNIHARETADPDPDLAEDTYIHFNGGSNAGPCVTLFTPAKNLFLAAPNAANGYRDARLSAADASGTSWSAPIAAGFAARVLQNNPTYTPAQVKAALLDNSVSTLDPATLNTYDYNGVEITGTPNKVLRLADVNITGQPDSTPAASSGTTALTMAAGGTSSVSYQWYEVNAGFDLATYKNGAHSSSAIAGATAATYNAPASTQVKAYWARATSSCGTADTDIAVVVPRPASPSNVFAIATGNSVTVTWLAGAGAEQYLIERKISGQPWTQADTVHASSLSFTETLFAPGGMVVYRVTSVAGAAYLPATNLAKSAPSNNDIANLNTYETIVAGSTFFKTQHLIELRQAVNALCNAVGAPPEYSAAELQLSSLQNVKVNHAHFTSLLTHINNIRTNPLIGLGAASFTETPAPNGAIKGTQVGQLRAALR